MATVHDIKKAIEKKAIEKLGACEFDRLRVWFEKHDAKRFDAKLASDARMGKLNRLADQAIAEFRSRDLTKH